jgi:hypothetical protein
MTLYKQRDVMAVSGFADIFFYSNGGEVRERKSCSNGQAISALLNVLWLSWYSPTQCGTPSGRYNTLLCVKSKVVPVLNELSTTPWRRMGCGCIEPHFLDLGTSWRWVISFTPRPLYPRRKSPWYPLDRRLDGPQSRSGWHGQENILDPTGTRTATPLSSSP